MDDIDKPRLLFLDDDEERQLYAFRHMRDSFRLEGVLTAEDYIKRILERPYTFDVTSLDHDLGLRHYVPVDDTNTGSEVARAFQDGRIPKEKWPKKIILHTWNTVGRDNMQNIFKDLGIQTTYIPFKV